MSETFDARLRAVFADVFETDASSISDDLSVATSTQWDSMRAIVLASTLESDFDVTFTDDELVELDSYRRVRESLIAKGAS